MVWEGRGMEWLGGRVGIRRGTGLERLQTEKGLRSVGLLKCTSIKAGTGRPRNTARPQLKLTPREHVCRKGKRVSFVTQGANYRATNATRETTKMLDMQCATTSTKTTDNKEKGND